MNTQSSPADEPIAAEDLVILSLEELEELLLQMYLALEKTIHTISAYAEAPTHIEAHGHSVIGLEKHFKQIWQELKVTVDAIITHAAFAEWNEQEWNNLAHGVREEIAFLQAVTSGEQITSVWLAQRDAVVAQIASLLKKATPEEVVGQWGINNEPASLHQMLDLGIKLVPTE